jgi:hypothetical protein
VEIRDSEGHHAKRQHSTMRSIAHGERQHGQRYCYLRRGSRRNFVGCARRGVPVHDTMCCPSRCTSAGRQTKLTVPHCGLPSVRAPRLPDDNGCRTPPGGRSLRRP